MSRTHRVLWWIERLSLAAGVTALTWCTYVYIDMQVTQRVAHGMLERTRAVTGPRPSAEASTSPHSVIVPAGSPVAELSIPRLRVSAVILEGSDDGTLRRGPGHIERTARPGEPGNVGIAGHRDTFFRRLRHAQVGDEVLLDTPEGRRRYQVSSVRIVSPRDVSVLDPTAEPTLTLVTCYPFSFVGKAPLRFVVRATGVDFPEPVTP
jgi:sortase A